MNLSISQIIIFQNVSREATVRCSLWVNTPVGVMNRPSCTSGNTSIRNITIYSSQTEINTVTEHCLQKFSLFSSYWALLGIRTNICRLLPRDNYLIHSRPIEFTTEVKTKCLSSLHLLRQHTHSAHAYRPITLQCTRDVVRCSENLRNSTIRFTATVTFTTLAGIQAWNWKRQPKVEDYTVSEWWCRYCS